MVFFLSAMALLQTPEADRQKTTIQKCHATARESLVGLEIKLRRKSRLEKAEEDEDLLDNETQALRQFAHLGQPFETYGMVVSDDGTVVMAGRQLAPGDIEQITAMDFAGNSYALNFDSMAQNYDAIFLKPREPLSFKPKPIHFEEFNPFELGSNYYATYLDRIDQKWQINVSPYIVTNQQLLSDADWYLIDTHRRGALLADSSGRTVGMVLDAFLWRTPEGRDSFIGKNLLADTRISFEQLQQTYASLEGLLRKKILRFDLFFRDERSLEPSSEKPLTRIAVYGVALDKKGVFFIPIDLDRTLVRRIDRIRSHEDPNIPCVFLGLFKKFSGILVEATDFPTEPAVCTEVSSLEPGALFITARFEERFGRSHLRLDTNRVFRSERTPTGGTRQNPRKALRIGTFILDYGARIIGFHAIEKREEDVEEMLEPAPQNRLEYLQRRSGEWRRIFLFNEARPELVHTPSRFDSKAVPMSMREERQLVWLGCEYQELTKALSELLGVQDRELTNDGRRGVIITDVYPLSPAERIGLQPGDILLSIQEDRTSREIDLLPEPTVSSLTSFSNMTPWRSSKNYLNRILTQLGAGKEVALRYLHGDKKISVSLILENAPKDFDTADRFKDDDLGLTVKELTYEVRYHQKLAAETTGVVVAKVEQGGRADVAKLSPLSVILKVNDETIRDFAHFLELLPSLKRSKSAIVQIISFGQTRLIDLRAE